MNRFVEALRDLCARHVLEEKWLIAPSLRVGHQWVEQVARSGQPALNVRVKSLRQMALELASPEMDRSGKAFLSGIRAQVLVGRLLARLSESGSGYLSALKPTPGLIRSLLGAVRDLRLAGLGAADLRDKDFEAEEKGREIRVLLRAYEQELRASGLADYADVLRAASAGLKEDPDCLAGDALVLMPEDALESLRGLERGLWDAVPQSRRFVLESDRPGAPRDGVPTDAALLACVLDPAGAPRPARDGTARIFRALGEVNEVREVLRRCVEEKIPFDEVEILHADSATYVPLLYELAWRLAAEGEDSVPMTFSEGIPPRYSRPARALAAWLEWIREDYPQNVVVRMIQDGLLQVDRDLPEAGAEGQTRGSSFTRLGAMLRTVPIGGGRDRYLAVLDREIAALESARIRDEKSGAGRSSGPSARKGRTHLHTGQGSGEEAGTAHENVLRRRRERLEGLRAIRSLLGDLLGCAGAASEGGSPRGQRKFLQGALQFLERHARCVNRFDEYARSGLVRAIRELAGCLGEEDVPGFEVGEWLSDQVQTSQVLGLGPRPGCLFVAPVSAGGHSGRRHTFIVGLDDSRFPGAGLQDPLLLDGERGRISSELPTAAARLARTLKSFAGLLARLRGTVTLSYCCQSLSDDRDLFPSPVVLSAYRILSGNREADLEALLDDLRHPASFAPDAQGRSLDATEWWLWRLCVAEPPEDPEEVLARQFPHLGRGFRALRARRSDRFTEYDGCVPEAGRDQNPWNPGGLVLSASRLEKLGACPMEYFFRYVLGIEPLEEHRIDPKVWLGPAERGGLLHGVFREFMSRLNAGKRLPEFDRDLGLLEEVLQEAIEAWRQDLPPPSPEVFEREAAELGLAARIFLTEEEAFCKESRPLCFEASVGLPPEGDGTILDSPDPVRVRLPGGRTVAVRGRIDRVDEVPGSAGRRFTVWDYKTGSTFKYLDRGRKRQDPFHQGRVVQNALYLALAEARLRETVAPGASVSLFGYFFPTPSAHGERVQWNAREMAGGGDVLARLCDLAAGGCFPFTDDPGDVSFSDFREAFGDVEDAARATKRKLANPANQGLGPFRELRGQSPEEAEE